MLEPSVAEPSVAEPVVSGPSVPPSSRPGGRMFMIAAALTGCALLSSIWGTVVTSRSETGPEAISASGPGAATPAAKPVRQRPPEPAARVLAPGEIGGEGIYGVGGELQPGTYRTDGPSPAAFDNCYWERSKDLSGLPKSVIASGLVSGPATVTIKPTDRAFKSSGCLDWTRVR